ncbi:MAG: outer membrane beta-barrel protein [Candidatus Binatia bacterium]
MGGRNQLERIIAVVLVAGVLGHAALAADKSLEERVRALEKKMERTEKAESAEQRSVAERIEAIEHEVKASERSIADQLGLSFHGVVAVDYLFDINRPDVKRPDGTVDQPALRSFENEKNSFILNLLNLHLERQSEHGIGFVTDIDFGKTADVVNNTTFFSRNSTGNGTNFFDARQFYLTYTVPIGNGIQVKAGRFITLAGLEVIKSYDNLNYNITNSILFGFAIPFTHTGLMGSYAFNDMVSLDLGIVNGWDNVVDNNDGKSVHGGINIAPDPRFSVYISGTFGPEQDDNGRSKRLLTTTVITLKPIDPLTVILEYDYGNESNVMLKDGTVVADPSTPGNKSWQGVAGYVVVAPTDRLELALRAELFDDPDGIRTGFQESGHGPGATFWEITPTVTFRITDQLVWRNEYRHDESDKRFFPREDTFVRGQDTIATELVYTF